jgi:hypothetical protein
MQRLNLTPTYRADARSERLDRRLLGREAHGQRIGSSATFGNLGWGEDTLQKAVAVTVKRRLDTGDFDDINSGF